MPEGFIQKLNLENNFGFVAPKQSDRKSIYFRPSDSANKLSQGMWVSYEERPSHDQKRRDNGEMEAYNLRPLDVAPMSPAHKNGPSTGASAHPTTKADPVRNQPIPYGFAPIDLKHAINDAPVWHDGSSGGDLLSGEIRCTLTVLTPLLVGNQQIGNQQIETSSSHHLYPLMMGNQVVVPGSSIKGMLRQSLAILLNAPMERVKDQRFTYRPNFVDWNRTPDKYRCLPAIVETVADGSVTVWPLQDVRSVYFILQGVLSPKEALPGSHIQDDFSVEEANGKKRIKDKGGDKRLKGKVCLYKGGIDGMGYLAKAFALEMKNSGGQVYSQVLVPESLISKTSLPIEPTVLKAYRETQSLLAGEHLERSPMKKYFNDAAPPLAGSSDPKNSEEPQQRIAKAISNASNLEPWQLIYIEQEVSSGKIVSLGHHFHYRWAYSNSIRIRNGALRPELGGLQEEEIQDGKPPERLTAARLLFGYVNDGEYVDLIRDKKKAYDKLAGRIAINHALSQKLRFLGVSDQQPIPLRPLGSPKPSAVEFYLDQTAAPPLKTYGDLPGDPGGNLGGRKVYPHQPSTNLDSIQPGRGDKPAGELNARAHYVCDRESDFRFTLRFARLRPWELGALLAVLEPGRLATPGTVQGSTRYAHKLGHGRPLGMGSVELHIDDLRLRPEKETSLQVVVTDAQVPYLQALRDRLGAEAEGVIQSWLNLHAFTGPLRSYPLEADRKGTLSIPTFHSKVRRDYATARRCSQFTFLLPPEVRPGKP
ncbi:MAG: TIGR03986 family CRISPR-associated RAMP protein [Betaproteobacteria bacterium]|nr:TIGR03986 family CRISPR-associated RAMP protein [Betaproteobacteria bacterium]